MDYSKQLKLIPNYNNFRTKIKNMEPHSIRNANLRNYLKILITTKEQIKIIIMKKNLWMKNIMITNVAYVQNKLKKRHNQRNVDTYTATCA